MNEWFGKLFDDKIEAVLEKPIPIAIVMIVGGIILSSNNFPSTKAGTTAALNFK